MANGQQGTATPQPKPPRAGRRPAQRRNNGGRRRGRRTQRPPPQRRRRTGQKRVTNVAKDVVQKEVKRLGLTGPAPTITQRATATLGSVQPNQSGNLELEFQMCLNPSLVKEATGSNQFGPIQISASTYSLWKLRSAIFHFQPLVGSSAVSGTVYRISLNLSGSPGSNSWSALGARHHLDVTPGQTRKFHVPKRMLQGTKEGWFQTDPKSDPTNSLGGSIEVHSLGKTMSTYQAQQFTGDLFLLEMTATWEFTNYNAQPGLLSMVKDTHESKVEITSDGNGSPMVMEVPLNSKLSHYTGGDTHAPTANGTLGETIWSVVDTGVSTLAGAVPPPFGWLVKGGWWFVRRILGKKTKSNGEEVAQFYVYQTLSDAQNDNRCITTSQSTATAATGEYEIQQITPGNVGQADSTAARAISPSARFNPELALYVSARYNQYLRPEHDESSEFMLTCYGPFNLPNCIKLNRSSTPDPVFTGVAELINPQFLQNGNPVIPDPGAYANRIPIYQKTGTSYTKLLDAVAFSSYNVDYTGGSMRIVNLLAYVEASVSLATSSSSSKIQHLVVAPDWQAGSEGPVINHILLSTTENSVTFDDSVFVPSGRWVLLTTVGTGNDTQGLYGLQWGRANMKAEVPQNATLTQLPYSTPLNPSPEGFILHPIPYNQARIQTYHPELYDHEDSPEESDDSFSEEDDPDCDDYHVPPDQILYDLTEDAALLTIDLQDRGIDRPKAAMVSQECFPSRSYQEFQGTYEQLLIDGCSPPFSRSHAIKRALPHVSRGHAE
nr:MAG: structural protein [Wufeng rodent astrovirus 1]